ncbi:hypothetical protein [Lentzea kentuckyensis]|uniref:hypothetical protein n=1 Tax=Lentzea kentuckyensis TaxID=360086 RepID=UPI001FE3CAEB|nr:hypothetical protein [Lentzea kentuckyensis]
MQIQTCSLELTAWADGVEIQRGTLSGTIPMRHCVDQFASKWRVELRDPATGDIIDCDHQVTRLPEPIG